MTSNIGAATISKNQSLGFTVGDETGLSYEDMKDRIMGELKKVFRPELLNRIDEVIVFHKLAKEEIKTIVDLMMKRLKEQMGEHEAAIELTEEAKELLVEKGYDPAMGARPLRRAIQHYIEDPLADFVLGRSLKPGSTIMALRSLSAERRVLLVTGEESAAQVKLRADRLGGGADVNILAETNLDDVCATLERERPEVCVIDSVQTLYAPELGSAPGSVAQVREAAGRLLRVAKEQGIATFLVGHARRRRERLRRARRAGGRKGPGRRGRPAPREDHDGGRPRLRGDSARQ